jgi:hypothetical protein
MRSLLLIILSLTGLKFENSNIRLGKSTLRSAIPRYASDSVAGSGLRESLSIVKSSIRDRTEGLMSRI